MFTWLQSMEDVRKLYRGQSVSFERTYWEDFKYVVHVFDNKTRRELGDGYVIYSFRKLTPLKGLKEWRRK